MPTPVEYALLASNAYGRSNEAGSQSLVKSIQHTLPMPTRWSRCWTNDVNDESNPAHNTGFLVAAYAKGGEIAVASAGTTDESFTGQSKITLN